MDGYQSNTVYKNDPLFSNAFNEDSPLLVCLRPLLKELKWPGNDHNIAQALPHLYPTLNLSGFLRVMRLLGFESNIFKAYPRYLDHRLAPCIYISKDKNDVYLIKEKKEDQWLVFNPKIHKDELIDIDISGDIYLFKKKDQKDLTANETDSPEKSWIFETLKQFKILFFQVFLIGFILNFFLLATPFFVMAVYDRVIGTASYEMLWVFLIGVLIAFASMFALQIIRSKLLAYIGAKLDLQVGNAIIGRVLTLAPSYTESGTVGAQLARLRDFDTVREFFTGPLFVLFLDLPFLILFITAIGFIGGHMIWVPIGMIVIFLLFVFGIRPFIRQGLLDTARTTSRYNQFLVEALNNIRSIRYVSSQHQWHQRFKKYTAERAYMQYKMTLLDSIVNTISDAVMTIAALSVLIIGTMLILDLNLTVGALIASMMIVWRILAPIKSLFITLTKLDQIKLSFRQIDNLMRLNPEQSKNIHTSRLHEINGSLTVNNLSLRYPGQFENAVMGITFKIPPGKMLGITGKNGSGKSTLLKAILKLYAPQSGQILLDGRNIEQIDHKELRQKIAYIPQKSTLFYGTIAQNLRLVDPTVSEGRIWEVLATVSLDEEIHALENGINTQIKDTMALFSTSFRQRLNIARALLKRSKLLLINDASDALDSKNDAAFIEMLKSIKGKITVLLISQRPSHLRIADQVIVLDQGKMLGGGPSEDVVKQLIKGLNND